MLAPFIDLWDRLFGCKHTRQSDPTCNLSRGNRKVYTVCLACDKELPYFEEER